MSRTRHFYAQACRYGKRTASDGDRLHAFASAKARDEWVDGDWGNRAPVTASQARRWYPDAFRRNWHYWGEWESWWVDHREWSAAPTGGIYRDL